MSLNLILKRSISTSSVSLGKRNFRKFQLFNKRGSRQFKETQSKNPDPNLFHDLGVRSIGYKDDDGKFVLVPEKIPDLIVPDLTECQFKPYVSYRSPDVVQSEFTAQDLFDVIYAPKIVQDLKEGKLDDNGNPLEPSVEEQLTPEKAKLKALQSGTDIF